MSYLTFRLALLSIVIVLIFIGCSQTDGKNESITLYADSSEKWKQDTMGCLGYRTGFTNDSFNIIERFVGNEYSSFLVAFGNPNATKTHNGGLISIYWIDCAMDSVNESKLYYTASQMMVFIGKDGIVEHINTIVP